MPKGREQSSYLSRIQTSSLPRMETKCHHLEPEGCLGEAGSPSTGLATRSPLQDGRGFQAECQVPCLSSATWAGDDLGVGDV